MEIITKNIKEIKPYKNNPRKNDDAVEYVANSIKEFGFKVPVIIDKNNIIVAGHTRVKAAERLGIEEIPCIVADDLTDEQIKAFRLADNKVGEIAEWDLEMLDLELFDIDMDMTDFGFEFEEEEEETEVIEDDYDIEPPVEPKAKYGDIYQLGRHRLMCGDATKIEDVEKLMNGENATIMFTSPPYNKGSNTLSGNKYMKKSLYLNDEDNDKDYFNLLYNFTRFFITKCEYCFINIQMLAGNKIDFIEYINEYKNNLVDIMIWNKIHTAPAMAKNVLNSQFEFIIIIKNEELPKRCINTVNFKGTVSNVYDGQPQRKNEYSKIHAGTFPIHLPEHIIKTFTKQSDSVIDCFGGTGTTLIACEQLNRTCYMMEIDPKYVDVIIDRWEQFTGAKAVKINV